MKRGDRWRAMTDEQIASFIRCDFCPLKNDCQIESSGYWYFGPTCEKKLIKWLKEEEV